MLREPQQETLNAIDGIIAGSPVRMIIVKATPGSGHRVPTKAIPWQQLSIL